MPGHLNSFQVKIDLELIYMTGSMLIICLHIILIATHFTCLTIPSISVLVIHLLILSERIHVNDVFRDVNGLKETHRFRRFANGAKFPKII